MKLAGAGEGQGRSSGEVRRGPDAQRSLIEVHLKAGYRQPRGSPVMVTSMVVVNAGTDGVDGL
jgi:hypothetical protein